MTAAAPAAPRLAQLVGTCLSCLAGLAVDGVSRGTTQPRVAPAIFAGGKMKVGQVIGSTDKLAGEATSRPIHYQDALYTLYHNLGILADRTTIDYPTGRPQYLLDQGKMIPELV